MRQNADIGGSGEADVLHGEQRPEILAATVVCAVPVVHEQRAVAGWRERQSSYFISAWGKECWCNSGHCEVLVLNVWRPEENHEKGHDSWSASRRFHWEPTEYKRYRQTLRYAAIQRRRDVPTQMNSSYKRLSTEEVTHWFLTWEKWNETKHILTCVDFPQHFHCLFFFRDVWSSFTPKTTARNPILKTTVRSSTNPNNKSPIIRYFKQQQQSDHPVLQTTKVRSSDTSNNNIPIIRYSKQQQQSDHPILQTTTTVRYSKQQQQSDIAILQTTTTVRSPDTSNNNNSPIFRYSKQKQQSDIPIIQTTTVRYPDTPNNNNSPISQYFKQQQRQSD